MSELDDAFVDSALTVLKHAILDNPDRAQRAYADMLRRYGPASVSASALVWIDAAIDALGIPVGEHGHPVTLSFLNQEDSRFHSADQVPEATRWAGQLLAARVAMDQDMYTAIFLTLPPGREEGARYLGALLQSTAAICRDSYVDHLADSLAATLREARDQLDGDNDGPQ